MSTFFNSFSGRLVQAQEVRPCPSEVAAHAGLSMVSLEDRLVPTTLHIPIAPRPRTISALPVCPVR